MSEPVTDALVKPDMRAVLSRTYLPNDLHGFLLPIFEAISNAMDAIESRFGSEAQEGGEIRVRFTHDFKNAWNPKVFVRYRDNERVFIEAFGYETLVENAKKRNQAFFSVLLDE